MSNAIKLSIPTFAGNEEVYTKMAIGSGQLATNGDFIDSFEEKFSNKLASHEIVALNSGTSSLHLSMVLLGIGKGDEVICQTFTFCASANPIIYLGATPVFVDSEPDTWNISPELLEDAILDRISNGKKPKAIVIVHLFGMPAKIQEIMSIASRYQIPVIEDAAEAVGSTYRGEYCGKFGDVGIYSFNGNKILSAGGGGALVSSKINLIQRAKYLSTQAREDLPYYQHLEIGFNYRMNNLCASVALAQLEQLDEFVEKRREINVNYRKLLEDFVGITFQPEANGSRSNFWLTAILIDEEVTGFSNDQVRVALMKNDIETRFLWKPLHLQPVFKEIKYFGGNVAKSLFHKGICLPSSVNLSFDDQERIVDIFKNELAKIF
ncbi:MAG: putative pyridoxal phosphate-dependent enzyme apparently involved in regulation of cell wall biogen [Algoriphagus marincola HL-49]|uniref:Putative pyridoxal phosphate-dependent enzyme apparently involved in regulation of cell wall biogen n=1 Tax=Algoriphagus marincola HL-49 TaxID=1305737 RepID=A0A0P8ACU6_9BACT|nr:MAG: putative pyridoxal phosphate-dependent enzyme apparently involved in regulation of cell wall biogen [Algoriphagus marincola HL-49]